MNHEEEPQPGPLTLEEVASLAKEMVLHDGYHVPTVIAEGNKGAVAMQITELGSTAEERQRQMFQAGFALAQTQAVGVLRQVFQVSEGWMSGGQPGERPHYPPSQDPNRKEILLVASLTVPSARNEVRVWEMIRDPTRKLVDLKAFDTGAEEAQSPLLNAFVAGFAMGSTDRAN